MLFDAEFSAELQRQADARKGGATLAEKLGVERQASVSRPERFTIANDDAN